MGRVGHGRIAGRLPHRRDDSRRYAGRSQPLSPQIPRKLTARTVDEVQYLAIDSDLLDVMITWDQTGTYEVAELQTQLENASTDDWMTTLLQTKAFHRIPPANIQAIFLRMQRVPLQGRRSRHQAG